jgi:hypothetical protein
MSLVLWFIWAAYASAIIFFDHRLRVRQALARGEVDFSDGAPLHYLVLSLIAGFLVLPVYFYATRKRWWGLLVGVLATFVSALATSVTVVGAATLILIARH